jgi:hypothetical protein
MAKTRPSGIWSALASLALLVLVAVKMNAFAPALHDILLLVQGQVNQIAVNNTTFLMMFPFIFAVVAMELPAKILTGIVQNMVLGKSGKHAISELLEEMGQGNHFMNFFVAVTKEELFARWLFLGLLTKIPFLSGTVAFYVLFIIGNGLWSLRHLPNFKDEEARHVLRVMPQFVAGIFYTCIFVKYGLLASILAHFASNAILFSTHKVQRTGLADFLLTAYATVSAAVSYSLMTKPFSDILIWFSNEPTFTLLGWEFWDYVKVSVFTTSCLIVLFEVLMYDREGEKKEEEKNSGVIGYLIGIPIVLGIVYGLFALLGLFVSSVPYRVLSLAILVSFLHKSASGSAMSRTFWVSLPDVYITICIFQALGFWLAAAYILVESAVQWPRITLAKIDD